VPGTTVDRQCGSSQQAIHFAAAGLIAHDYDVVVAGGVESMSRVPMGSAMANGQLPLGRRYADRYSPEFPNQGISAELISDQWGYSRTELDEFALLSHERAAAATDAGRFDGQIVPVEDMHGVVVDRDEGIRRDSTVEGLANLRSAFREAGVITGANSSQISDGAAAVLMMTAGKAHELGLEPIVRIHSTAVVGSDPVLMLTGPIEATRQVLRRGGLSIRDVGAFEVNEAFAPIPLAWLRDTGADANVLNPNGGAIALGHPLGASGARLMTTLVHHMRDQQIQYGLQTMCEGGGQANATLVELV
jgi:acetyl-CoA acyltransferase